MEVGASIVGTVHMLVYVLLQKDLDIGNMNDRVPHKKTTRHVRAPLARGRPSGGEALSSRLALPCGEGVAAWALVGHLGCAGAAAGRAALVETAA